MPSKIAKRSPHKADLGRDAANVMARNLRAILVERYGVDPASFSHQQAHNLIAEVAGYKNSQHLAANYAAGRRRCPAAADPGLDADAAMNAHTAAIVRLCGIPAAAETASSWASVLRRAVHESRTILVTTPEDARSILRSVPGVDAAVGRYLAYGICDSDRTGWFDKPSPEEVLDPGSAKALAEVIGDRRFLIFDERALRRLNQTIVAEGGGTLCFGRMPNSLRTAPEGRSMWKSRPCSISAIVEPRCWMNRYPCPELSVWSIAYQMLCPISNG